MASVVRIWKDNAGTRKLSIQFQKRNAASAQTVTQYILDKSQCRTKRAENENHLNGGLSDELQKKRGGGGKDLRKRPLKN